MTYYEELGIPVSATEEDIHRVHRTLTKLLHPDQYSDDQMRRLADLQLRRVNVVVDRLLDPVERHVYDASLRVDASAGPALTSTPVHEGGWKQTLSTFRTDPRHWKLLSWPALSLALLAAFGIAALLFKPNLDGPAMVNTADGFSLRNPNAGNGLVPGCDEGETHEAPGTRVASDRREPPGRAMIRKASGPEEIMSERSHPDPDPRRRKDKDRGFSEAPAWRDEARGMEVAAKSGPSSDAPTGNSQVSDAAPTSGSPAANMPSASQAAAPLTTTDSDAVAGVWIYAPPAVSGPGEKKLYRPEYIELRMRADSGVLVGQYKGRYVIPDRPISPTVTFNFSGKLNGKSGSFPWKSPDGSSGKVELKVLTARSLQVDWKTVDVRDSLGLVSGTAVLVKRGD